MLNARSIPKIARWAAAAAIVTVLAVAAGLAYRAWRAARTARPAPAAVPSSVKQRSLEFTFSKVEGKQTVFTVHAAQATQFSHDKPSLLEDVDIVVYGEHGERHDEIHTRSCDYEPSTGGIVCHGKVQIDLSSAPAPGKPAKEAEGGIHIEARGVGFNRDTGEATSDAPLAFRFPQGQGSAVGVRYSSRQADLTLERNVELTLAPERPGGLPVNVQAPGGLNYDRKSGRVVLRGPVEIGKGGRTLETAALTLDLDEQMRPRQAVADGRATVRIAQEARSGSFEADRLEIDFDSQGRAEKIDADGNVIADQVAPAAMRLTAQRLSIALDPPGEQPRTVDATGDVRLSSKSGASSERLVTDAVHLTTVPVAMAADGTARAGSAARAAKAAAVRLDRATSGGPATVVWQTGEQRLRLDAKRLSAAFDADSRIRELDGRAGVRLERREAGEEPVVTTADALVAHFVAGEWSDADESGNVRARQGTRRASAERTRWTRSENELELSGEARIGDPTGQTLADKIIWNQQSGQLRAAGRVRSTYFANAQGETGVAPSAGPANVVAAALVADPSTGEATYSGDARLWQGDLAIQADRIDLRRASGELVAQGNVMGAFPQEPHELGKTNHGGRAGRNAPSGPVLWRVRANRLTYVNAAGGTKKTAAKGTQGEAVLDGSVEAWSSEGKIDAEKVVLTLRRDSSGRAELAQANASGGVKIRQGGRWGQGEKLIYLATPGKFILTGGHPSLHDTSGDLVRGDQLTFYVANDTILVESSKGSRTLTRHPVPN